ncbi:peptidase MA family metallohydrolase [Candidatus Nitrospira bockiana]
MTCLPLYVLGAALVVPASGSSEFEAAGLGPAVAASASGPAAEGWARLRAEAYREAADAFARATKQAPNDPSVLLGLGLARFHLFLDDLAAPVLVQALRLDPLLGQAHVVLGDLAVRRDELAEAIEHYEAAARLDPNDVVVQDRLEGAGRARAVESGLHRFRTPHFIVKYEPDQPELGRSVAGRVERWHARIAAQLPRGPGARFVLILYSDRRLAEVDGNPTWAGGLFDGRIHLALRRVAASTREADAVLAHEVTHALLHRVTRGRAPTWIEEGLALYFEGRTPAWSEAQLRHRSADLRPLHALHGSFLSLPADDAAVVYAQSFSAVQFLIDRHGFGRLRELLSRLGEAKDFAGLFESVFREPYHEFEASWAQARGRDL